MVVVEYVPLVVARRDRYVPRAVAQINYQHRHFDSLGDVPSVSAARAEPSHTPAVERAAAPLHHERGTMDS